VARRPTAVAFDVNETLFSLDRLGDAVEEAGLPGHALDLWFARTLSDGFALATTGSFATFGQLGAAHLRRILASYGIEGGDRLVGEVLDAFHDLEAYQDARPALERLRDADVRAVTVTNGSADVTRSLLAANGLDELVEDCFDVAGAGRWKPAAEPYHLVAGELGVPPEELALVAVHSWDVHGAKHAGLTAAWVSRREGEPVPGMDDADVKGRTLVEAVDGLLALPS
jgi:2-haloacid dehalogenase